MIVADTNLIAYLLIESPQTAEAAAVLQKDREWAVPALWRSEFRNVLALYLRQGHLAPADAVEYMQEAESLVEGREYHVPSAAVLRLSKESGCTAYDCEFVYVAQELGVPLVTSDKKLLRAFPALAVSFDQFVE